MGNSAYTSMSVDIPENAPLLKHRQEEQTNVLSDYNTICCRERELSRDKEDIRIKFKKRYKNNCCCKGYEKTNEKTNEKIDAKVPVHRTGSFA